MIQRLPRASLENLLSDRFLDWGGPYVLVAPLPDALVGLTCNWLPAIMLFRDLCRIRKLFEK